MSQNLAETNHNAAEAFPLLITEPASHPPQRQSAPFTTVAVSVSEWDKLAPDFLIRVETFGNANTSRLITEKFSAFREHLDAGMSCDINKFRKDCEIIFRENLPRFQVPPMMDIFNAFFLALIIVAISTFAIGLVMIFQAELAACIGLITTAAVNFKALGILSAALGGIAATVSAVSMFRPATVANNEFNVFAEKVTKKPDDTSTVLAIAGT